MPTPQELEAKANKPAEDSLRLHALYQGKIQVALKCPIRDIADFAYWYTPGVAAPCRAIQADPARIYELTNCCSCEPSARNRLISRKMQRLTKSKAASTL